MYEIIGSVGIQHRATNTPSDTGYNGVQGGGELGCGRRPTVEGFSYQPTWVDWQTR